jgi:transketolase
VHQHHGDLLLATGSEVHLALEAGERLGAEGINARVVSMPCWELFDAQPQTYRHEVLPPGQRRRIAVEAGVALGWEHYVGLDGIVIGLDRFGASAPGGVVMAKLGFTVERIVAAAHTVLST